MDTVNYRLHRLAYAIEFLIALPVVYTVWSQVAGQVNLDLVLWYWKLGLGVGMAWAAVRATAAAVEQERAWNLRTLKWVAVVLLLAVGAGMVTHYFRVYYENEEEMIEEQEEPAFTASRLERQRMLRRGGLVHVELGQGAAHPHLAPAAGKLDEEFAVVLGSAAAREDLLAGG